MGRVNAMYECQTCGQTVNGLNAARKHAKQGHKTQREAFQAGQLHKLTLITKGNSDV